jgi:hypothetical protein
MLVVGGNASPSAEDVKALLATVGVEVSLALNMLQIESLVVHFISIDLIILIPSINFLFIIPPLIILLLLISPYHLG